MIHFYTQNLVENKRKVAESLTVPPYLDEEMRKTRTFFPMVTMAL